MKLLKKEKMIDHKLFKNYFEYFSPSDIYKNLNKTTDTKKKQGPIKYDKN